MLELCRIQRFTSQRVKTHLQDELTPEEPVMLSHSDRELILHQSTVERTDLNVS